jgi:uncharacterized protein YbjT (DUF2867 family)
MRLPGHEACNEPCDANQQANPMTIPRMTVLVVGATGSIGRLVVAEALGQRHTVRALVRNPRKVRQLPAEAEVVVGDVTRPATLASAMGGIDAVVLTLGSDGQGKLGAESVDYGGVRNVLVALGGRTARIALMTSIGVTNRTSAYNRSTESHDWKRRSERLVRASGLPYTIVRPGWFDYNSPDEHRLVLRQGDTRQAENPGDGAVARRQIAEVLVRSLTCEHALGKTFELVATQGPAQDDIDALFAALEADPPGALGQAGRPGQYDQPRHHHHPARQGRTERATRRGLPADDRFVPGEAGWHAGRGGQCRRSAHGAGWRVHHRQRLPHGWRGHRFLLVRRPRPQIVDGFASYAHA